MNQINYTDDMNYKEYKNHFKISQEKEIDYEQYDANFIWKNRMYLEKAKEKNGYDYISEAFHKLYLLHKSTYKVGEIMDCSDTCVTNHLIRMGVKKRGKGGGYRNDKGVFYLWQNFKNVNNIWYKMHKPRLTLVVAGIVKNGKYGYLRCSHCHKMFTEADLITYDQAKVMIKAHRCLHD